MNSINSQSLLRLDRENENKLLLTCVPYLLHNDENGVHLGKYGDHD